MALSLLLSISIIFIFFTYKLYQKLRYNLPPGPYPRSFIGNLRDIKPDRCRCYADWSKTYGPIISVWFGSKLHVIVSNSELAKEVLKDNDHQLANRQRNKAAATVSKNGKDLIWADYSPHYVKLRKLCTLELFSLKSIEALRHIREDEVAFMIDSLFDESWNPENFGKGLVLREYLGLLAFNNITRLVFGKKFVGKDGKMNEQGLEFKAILGEEFMAGASLGMIDHIKWLSWILWFNKNATLSKHMARKYKLTRSIMEEHKQMINGDGVKQNLVDTLLGLQEKYELSEDTIIGLLWNMITAGMDTIAITVEWAMAELVKNPRVQQKAQEELDRVIGLDRVMVESDIANLPYLQCITKETLRLHPPTPLMLPHEANADVKIGKYDVPKGTSVYVNVWAIGRDATVWDEPLEFRPERFLVSDVDMKGHDFRLLPFGAGRRMCPAAQLSINLVTSMIGHLVHHFKWVPPMGVEEIDMSESPGIVSYMATPLRICGITRLRSELYDY